MTTRAPQPSTALAEAESLERLYRLLAPLHIGAGWAKPTQSLWGEPRRDHGAFDDRAVRGRCDADQPHDRQQSPRLVAGSGSTDVNGERFNWQRHAHTAAEAAVLFRVSDEPVMSRLGFLRSAD